MARKTFVCPNGKQALLGSSRRSNVSLSFSTPATVHSRGVRAAVNCSASRSRSSSTSTSATAEGETRSTSALSSIISGKAYVTKDNIDTDQIIPAEWLMLVPSKPDELEKLGAHAMEGLPVDLYPTRYILEGEMKSEYKIIIGGENFGCGSSREHAPISIAAAGSTAIVAQSYARIFFRNCISTGEVYPCEVDDRICEKVNTGDDITIDLDENTVFNHTSGEKFDLKPLGEARPVIEAGGMFEYARKMGIIKK